MAAFRLERLLHVYRRQEENCRWVCGQAEKRLAAVARALQELIAEIVDSGCTPGFTDSEGVRRLWLYRSALGEGLTRLRQDLRDAEAELVAARSEYLAVRRRRKTLEALQERHAAQDRLERARREQVLLDEAGLNTYWREVER
jgi:flagellar export protein FliJ